MWRAKWSPSQVEGVDYLVTASMQGGSRVYQLHSSVSDDTDSIKYALSHAIEQRDDRNSNHLAYGIDVLHRLPDNESKEVLTLASCSFYDNLVQVWTADFNL